MLGTTVRGRDSPNPGCYLSDTDIVRASKPQHPVQGSCGDCNLRRLGLVGARAKGITDHAFVAADRRLDLGAKIVAAGFLPRYSTTLCNGPQMAVALCRSGLGRATQNRAGPRWHDDGSIRIMFGDGLVNPVLIVIAVGGEGGNGIGNLTEQPANHRGIVDFLPGHLDRDDLAAIGIDANVQLASGPAAGRAVLFDRPFVGSAELQTSAVHEQMQRA